MPRAKVALTSGERHSIRPFEKRKKSAQRGTKGRAIGAVVRANAAHRSMHSGCLCRRAPPQATITVSIPSRMLSSLQLKHVHLRIKPQVQCLTRAKQKGKARRGMEGGREGTQTGELGRALG